MCVCVCVCVFVCVCVHVPSGQMSELLFEAYNVPAVAYGVDALFGAHQASQQQLGRPLEEAIVVSCGHTTTHILPVVNGRLDATHSKRYTVVYIYDRKTFSLVFSLLSFFRTYQHRIVSFFLVIYSLSQNYNFSWFSLILSLTDQRRINLGGANIVAYLNRLLQLSRPPLLPHLTLSRAQEIAHSHCYLAVDYHSELQQWGSGQPPTH